MTELDLEIPGLAAEIINEYGKDIAYSQREPGTYDPATSMADPTPADRTIKGIVEPYKAGQALAAGLIEAGDLKVTAARESFDGLNSPSPGDVMIIDGANYNTIAVLPTYSGELIAIYEFQIRRG